MFEIGDNVVVNCFSTPKSGVIVKWYYDEGNVWVVQTDGRLVDCADDELTPANDKPYNGYGEERYIYSDL